MNRSKRQATRPGLVVRSAFRRPGLVVRIAFRRPGPGVLPPVPA